jgi:hypothetical protein
VTGLRAAALALALVAVACEQPPTKEIAAAQQQVERARTIGAEQYAPDRFKQAESALALAQQKLEARDYRAALSAANDAAESARIAINNTGPAKSAARNSAELALGEIRSALDRAVTERAQAVKAGVPKSALAPLDARGHHAEQVLSALGPQLQSGNIELVKSETDALRIDVAPLAEMYRTARIQQSRRKPRRR